MPQVIIGHTTDTTARIWVRGNKSHVRCSLTLRPEPADRPEAITLSESTDYTGTFDVKGLTAATPYAVTASFGPDLSGSAIARGRFQTFPKQVLGEPFSFSFVLSSCNLSVVNINNLLALITAAAGTSVARSSLDLPAERWRWPWLRLGRKPLKWALYLIAMVTQWATGLKQPPPPFLRSPFLKLCAVFEASVLRVIAHEASMPGVGDIVWSSSGKGVLASSAAPIAVDNKHEKPPDWLLLLTHVEGTFKPGEAVFRRAPGSDEAEKKSVGCVHSHGAATPWFERPAFFIHAGDQIYYDFPSETVEPDRDKYRRAYREAWFDDHPNRHLLAHWPHYMTWDDHEIADQFAVDFTPQADGVKPAEYLDEATIAYREYVQPRHPSCEGAARGKSKSHWYCFDKGATRFFVLDTRTQRYNNLAGQSGQMIDPDQMQALLDWMVRYKNDVKFVVTSVPFVADINENRSRESPKWNTHDTPGRRGNDENDTWSAGRFAHQRTQIIRHIFQQRIERVVFLTGDMHCCYHATMRIGREDEYRKKYECITVYELAGGPVNQLQLAKGTDFYPRRTGRIADAVVSASGTPKDLSYEVMLNQFHSQVNAVMHVRVDYVERDDITTQGRAVTPEIEWNAIRTLTDNGALAWTVDGNPGGTRDRYATDARGDTVRIHEPVMSGRITFARKRGSAELGPW